MPSETVARQASWLRVVEDRRLMLCNQVTLHHTSPPEVVAWGPNRLDVFVVGSTRLFITSGGTVQYGNRR